MSKVIEIKDLKKSFGKVEALKNVSFELEVGDVLGFIGPNGAGKSTAIRILLGAIKRDAGYAKIFGKDVWKDSFEIHKRISYIPGEVELWPNLSGGEIIDVFMKLHGAGNKDKKEELINSFELDPKKKAKTYSKGNKQKVALIAALAVEADLYIFDEPTSGLDPLMEQIFQKEIEKLKNNGKSILLSSHILSEVERLADKIVIIRQGKIVESGKLKDLRHLSWSKIILETEKDPGSLKKLDGIYDFSQKDNEVAFSIDNNYFDTILLEASKLGVKKFESTQPSLEDLFMRHYED